MDKPNTAMGKKMAPEYAYIFMKSVENSFLSSFQLKPSVYCRYVDDIIMIWAHVIENLKTLSNNAKNIHSSISLTNEACTALFLRCINKN